MMDLITVERQIAAIKQNGNALENGYQLFLLTKKKIELLRDK